MDFLVPTAIGVIIGGLAAYFLFGKDTKAPPPKPETNDSVGRVLVQTAHYAAFGPVGMSKEAQDDAFNRVWVWADKSESGMPRG
jgi:hypothetical protein